MTTRGVEVTSRSECETGTTPYRPPRHHWNRPISLVDRIGIDFAQHERLVDQDRALYGDTPWYREMDEAIGLQPVDTLSSADTQEVIRIIRARRSSRGRKGGVSEARRSAAVRAVLATAPPDAKPVHVVCDAFGVSVLTAKAWIKAAQEVETSPSTFLRQWERKAREREAALLEKARPLVEQLSRIASDLDALASEQREVARAAFGALPGGVEWDKRTSLDDVLRMVVSGRGPLIRLDEVANREMKLLAVVEVYREQEMYGDAEMSPIEAVAEAFNVTVEVATHLAECARSRGMLRNAIEETQADWSPPPLRHKKRRRVATEAEIKAAYRRYEETLASGYAADPHSL